ncbi:MarR family winged helix-turn-helix transcriptional regulator [Providencia stuartii]|uniref:MarR family winged helix-turn-helix transcriptional regulator n=1 Tax=Providencia stuartii TaxID=588 RepID=UPI001A300708|nr:MarR family winged helix-turn-helix transcriptional regulator [Providencia stuartii]WAZ74858.1 MarR family winged helix-turn-helix transcriptional regulator [Providencia stuartii]HAU5733285.1 MarR family transcriptional regulator [Providencia stuartii]HAU5774163.1 MarR family transcriptional regulator [Providencia stuartii]HEM6894790.1 winged helix-turn-helix transcriptional regulator [Providencia stuartii]HEM6896446.1 winged helix-turn-helix transcriptional regulator [Providencia stuartii]
MRTDQARVFGIISRAAHRYMKWMGEPYGINAIECLMLLHIQQYDESTLEQISRAMVIDKSVTTRGISKFLEQGWVEKKSSLIDKRAYHISLTAVGEQIVEELNDKLNKWNDYLAADLTEQDAEQLFGFLYSLAKNAVDISIKDFPERFTDNQE